MYTVQIAVAPHIGVHSISTNVEREFLLRHIIVSTHYQPIKLELNLSDDCSSSIR